MRLRERLRGKVHAFWTLAAQARYLRNAAAVFAAYRRAERLPPLELRGPGRLTLQHGPEDDAWALFREVFVERCYTGGGFYRPRPGDLVLDVGANVGVFALFLCWLEPGVRVHAFEPAGGTRARLLRNVTANGLEGRVFVHPDAVLDRDGRARLAAAPRAGDASLFRGGPAGGEGQGEDVPTVSLGTALARAGGGPVDLLKLDVEGAEVEVVEGADPACWGRIARVAAEVHEEVRPGCTARVLAVLRRHYPRAWWRATAESGALGLVWAKR